MGARRMSMHPNSTKISKVASVICLDQIVLFHNLYLQKLPDMLNSNSQECFPIEHWHKHETKTLLQTWGFQFLFIKAKKKKYISKDNGKYGHKGCVPSLSCSLIFQWWMNNLTSMSHQFLSCFTVWQLS